LGNCLRKVPGGAGIELLRKAFESGIAIEGIVTGTNKGGLEIAVSGAKAFCPFSQMDLTYLDRPEAFVGTTQKFIVTQFEEEGKNIVVSRRAVLQAEREALAINTRKRLGVGEVFKGKVTRLTPFGAFIDLGGIEGLVHISEISRSQVADPADHLTVGQEVTVQVLQIKTDEKDLERISLSLKALEPDPWERELGLDEGDIVWGRVRNLAPFGAFIEIAPGLEGLVHISEMAYKRIRHPKDLIGEQVQPSSQTSVALAGHRLTGHRDLVSVEIPLRQDLPFRGKPSLMRPDLEHVAAPVVAGECGQMRTITQGVQQFRYVGRGNVHTLLAAIRQLHHIALWEPEQPMIGFVVQRQVLRPHRPEQLVVEPRRVWCRVAYMDEGGIAVGLLLNLDQQFAHFVAALVGYLGKTSQNFLRAERLERLGHFTRTELCHDVRWLTRQIVVRPFPEVIGR
jgi:predicted RNA-binding protein with RPS1 domain